MSCMTDMTSTSFATAVVPRSTSKSFKMASVLSKEEKICYKMDLQKSGYKVRIYTDEKGLDT